MAVSYNKLWKLLIDLKMKKKELQELAGVSSSLITKLGREEPVTTAALMKICIALKCDIGDIMEIVPNELMTIAEENDMTPRNSSAISSIPGEANSPVLQPINTVK